MFEDLFYAFRLSLTCLKTLFSIFKMLVEICPIRLDAVYSGSSCLANIITKRSSVFYIPFWGTLHICSCFGKSRSTVYIYMPFMMLYVPAFVYMSFSIIVGSLCVHRAHKTLSRCPTYRSGYMADKKKMSTLSHLFTVTLFVPMPQFAFYRPNQQPHSPLSEKKFKVKVIFKLEQVHMRLKSTHNFYLELL